MDSETIVRMRGQRWTWRAEFVKFTVRRYLNHDPVPALALRRLTDPDGDRWANRITVTCDASALGLQPGDLIEFEARIEAAPFRLSHATKMRKISRAVNTNLQAADLPLFRNLQS